MDTLLASNTKFVSAIIDELNALLKLCPLPSKPENILLERHSKAEFHHVITDLIDGIVELRKKIGNAFWRDQFTI